MTIPSSADTLVVSAAAGAVIALLVTSLVVPLTIGFARRLGIIDEPGARSSHTVATPRLGGIGVAVGALAGLAAAAVVDPAALRSLGAPTLHIGLALAATAVCFGLIGLADDLLRGIPVSVRLAAQLLVGGAAVIPWIVADRADPTSTTSVVASGAIALVAAMWVIGYVNAFNFMDGVDGISGGVAIVVGVDLVVVGALDDRAPLVVAGAVLVGTAAGFLRLNLRPATVFLGDGGSYFLGAWIAIAAVIGIGLDTPPEAVLAVTVPYLADTTCTLARRIARGADWRASHHEHAYQQLIDQGRSHRSVAAVVAATSALWGALGLVSLVAGPAGRVITTLAVVAVAAAYVAAPAVLDRRARHRADDTGGALDGAGAPDPTPVASARSLPSSGRSRPAPSSAAGR